MSISRKRLEEIAGIPDEAIDTSEIPELGPGFWENARLVLPKGKEQIALRVDVEVLDWFRRQGKGYQSRMNAVLRSYMEAMRQSAGE